MTKVAKLLVHWDTTTSLLQIENTTNENILKVHGGQKDCLLNFSQIYEKRKVEFVGKLTQYKLHQLSFYLKSVKHN